jgi:hypothetical protein
LNHAFLAGGCEVSRTNRKAHHRRGGVATEISCSAKGGKMNSLPRSTNAPDSTVRIAAAVFAFFWERTLYGTRGDDFLLSGTWLDKNFL